MYFGYFNKCLNWKHFSTEILFKFHICNFLTLMTLNMPVIKLNSEKVEFKAKKGFRYFITNLSLLKVLSIFNYL